MNLEGQLSTNVGEELSLDIEEDLQQPTFTDEEINTGKRGSRIGGFIGVGIGTIAALAFGYYVNNKIGNQHPSLTPNIIFWSELAFSAAAGFAGLFVGYGVGLGKYRIENRHN